MSKRLYCTANLTDKELKEEGNALFGLRKYDEAITCYSKAIIKNPSVPQYYTNRALCYMKLKKWQQVRQDCKNALDLDGLLVKGHFFLGLALFELELYDECIKHFHRAYNLSKDQRINYGDDIAFQLRQARKKRFSLMEEKRISQEIETLNYVKELINSDKEKRMEEVAQLKDLDKEAKEQRLREISETCDTHWNEINDLYIKMDDRRRKREVPDYLCGKISFEILQEPVITPSGITFERKDLEEHLQRVGHFDPVTRVHLTQDQLIPNFALKEVVDSFLLENEWALDY